MDNSRETLVKRAPRTIGLVWSAFGWRLWSKDDDLPDDPNAVRYVPASDLTRLNAKVEELERERLKLRTALIGTGRNLGAFLANEVSSDFLTLLPEEARLLKARLARAVEVKALEWTKLSTGWIAHTSFHAYEVVATDHGFMATYANRDFAWGEEETMKVAAQADFEQRIRSALVLSEQENPHG